MIRSLELEACLGPCQVSMITFLLLALKYFLKKAPSWIFDRVLKECLWEAENG